MKSDLKAKYVQHLINKKKGDEGFTLIELLVVIIIIGILSAIALPSFLNQANKARESEAKQYVGAANRAQQAFFLEQQDFTEDFQRLGLGLNTSTANYTYDTAGYVADTEITTTADPANPNTLRAFVGGVSIGQSDSGETTTRAILCQSPLPATAAATVGGLANNANSANAPACTNTAEEIS